MVTERVPDPTPENIALVLSLTTERGDAVRTYLAELLCALWLGEASATYGMTGESDWQYDLYWPMQAAGLIPQWRDGYGVGYRSDGSNVPEDQRRADVLICAAIAHLMEGPS